MMSDQSETRNPSVHLPDAVQDMLTNAYWRIDIRPFTFRSNRIPFASLEPLVRENQVRLRGWYFPHLSNKSDQTTRGTNYFANWSHFRNYEYWRFYESAHLFHLHGVREAVDESWKEKLERDTRMHLNWQNPDWTRIRGFLDIINFLYTVTETFEFAARLASALDLSETIDVSIKLNNIAGFVLTAEASRSWDYEYRWDESVLGNVWSLPAESAREDPATAALEATVWFFERFGWTGVSPTILRSEQAAFLAKR